MLNTLFNPIGTLSGKRYWRAGFTLVAVELSLKIIALLLIVSMPVDTTLFGIEHFKVISFWTSLLVISMIYPYFCIFGKRFQGLGLSRFWVLPTFGLYFLILTKLGQYIGFIHFFAGFSILATTLNGIVNLSLSVLPSLVIMVFVGLLRKSNFLKPKLA